MKDKVKVVFFGKEYSIVTDAEKNYVLEVAGYLEQKVKEVNGNGAPVAISPPILMASLEIIDDFFVLQREFDEFKRTTERKTKDLVRLLESSGTGEKRPFLEKSLEDPFRSRGKSV